jgi:eukaryotic-like serine/threonine-protein kinase
LETQPDGKYEQLDRLAEDFARRLRLGERPSLGEYAERHPELACEIRELFPALVNLESAEVNDDPYLDHPRSIGDYCILRVIGRGGMGVVYEARQVSLGRRVALKVLPIQRSRDPRGVERFRREARAAAQLHHTNIVPVFEVGQVGEICFYAMQFIDGQGLDQVIEDLRRLRHPADEGKSTLTITHRSVGVREESLSRCLLTGEFRRVAANDEGVDIPPVERSTEEARLDVLTGKSSLPRQVARSSVIADRRRYLESVARIGQQVAAALAYAHDRGIVHRDVKPSNLLLDASGTVWVADFGLAKTDEEGLTETGDILGTYRYMAPERFDGGGDGRADVYALGLTLYELLLLRPAFASNDRVQLLKWVQEREPERPRSVDPGIPADLETIVLKAIAKDPTMRYQSAESMGEDLRRFLVGEPILARRANFLERGRLWCRRYPALAALYVVLVAAVAGATLAAISLNALLRKSEHQRQLTDAAETKAVDELYRSLLAQADASRSGRKLGQRFTTLEAVRKAAVIAHERGMPAERFDRLRTLAISALALPDFRIVEEGQPLGPGFTGLWSSADSNRVVACGNADRTIDVFHRQDGSPIAKVKFEPGPDRVILSPDGRYLVAYGSQRFRAWDLAGSEPRVVAVGDERGAVFHPDSRHLAMGRGDGAIDLIDLSGRDPAHIFVRPGQDHMVPLGFNAQGTALAVNIRESTHVLDVRTGKIRTRLNHLGSCYRVSWHPGGQYVSLAIDSDRIEIWDVESNSRLSVMENSNSGGLETVFSPDGEMLISGGWEGKLRVWEVRTGKQVLLYPGANCPSFGPDGRCILLRNRKFVLAEFTTGSEYRTIKRYDSGVLGTGVAFHPDGRLLAALTADGLHFYDLVTGQELASRNLAKAVTARFVSRNELVINSEDSLFSLSVRSGSNDGSFFSIGPPTRLHAGSNASFSSGKQGGVICQGRNPNVGSDLILRAGNSLAVRHLKFNERSGGAAVSTDGRFAVTFTSTEIGKTRIWQVDDGRLLAELDTGGSVRGDFSPDNRWLVLGGHKWGRLIPVDDWERGRPVEWDRALDFSPDSKLLAVETGEGVIRLVDTETGDERARLEDPNQNRADSMAFTPDASRLVIFDDSGGIHVWDLRLIRKELAALGLDWQGPEIPEVSPSTQASTRLRVELELSTGK